jgi:hypothetical protein
MQRLIAGVFILGIAAAQKPPLKIEVGPNVSVSDAGTPHVEPYIAAHPDDARNLIITVTHISGEQEGFVETFATPDGGRTWKVSQLPQLREAVARKETAAPMVDSWVTFASDGTAYCSLVAPMQRGHAWGRLPLLVYRSRDRGATWEGPSVAGPFFDRPALVAHGRGAEKRLYAVAMGMTAPSGPGVPSSVAVLTSSDDGASFQRTFVTPDNLGHNALRPVVSPEGTLIVSYVDFPATGRAEFEKRRPLMRTSRMYVVLSGDRGRTFGTPRFVADIPRAAVGFPELAVDLSEGRYRGRLYMAWNGESEERQNVMVARSEDQGETWVAASMKASEGGPAYFASIAVSTDGTLGVAWLQHEREESRKRCWRIYFAASSDGGVSFSAPTAVSSVVSCPDAAANKYALPRFERGGDYMGLAAAADKTFHVAWPDCRDGAFQIYTAAIRADGK